MASIELLKIIVQLINISPSFNFDDGLDLDDGFQTDKTLFFKIYRFFLEIKNQECVSRRCLGHNLTYVSALS